MTCIQVTPEELTDGYDDGKTAVLLTADDLITRDITGGLEIIGYRSKYRNIIIPQSLGGKDILSIAANVFQGKRLVAVAFPHSITNIGNNAFQGNALTKLTLPSATETIGSNAFQSNNIAGTLDIPTTITSMSGNAFNNNPRLENVIIETINPSLGGGAFASMASPNFLYVPSANIDDYKTERKWVDGFTAILPIGADPITAPIPNIKDVHVSGGTQVVDTVNETPDLVIPEEIDGRPVVSIGENSFQEHDLESVDIPASVTKIEKGAFATNSKLSHVTIRSSIPPSDARSAFTNIASPSYLFVPAAAIDYYKSNTIWVQLFTVILTIGTDESTVPLPEYTALHNRTGGGITILRYRGNDSNLVVPSTIDGKPVVSISTLQSIPGLTTVTLPSTVTDLGYNVLQYNPDLTTLTMLSTTPPTTSRPMNLKSVTLYVPSSSVATYQTTAKWGGEFATIEAIP